MSLRVHVIKSWSRFFQPIIQGKRTADIRHLDDRDFQVDDLMLLREWDPIRLEYTGLCAVVQITYIQTNEGNPCAISHKALNDGYLVLSIKLTRWDTWDDFSQTRYALERKYGKVNFLYGVNE
jgi:hypothetical protein